MLVRLGCFVRKFFFTLLFSLLGFLPAIAQSHVWPGHAIPNFRTAYTGMHQTGVFNVDYAGPTTQGFLSRIMQVVYPMLKLSGCPAAAERISGG